MGRRALRGASLMLSLSLAAGVVSLPAAAGAADTAASNRSSARRLVLEGDAFYAKQNYASALERYQQAYQLVHVPTVGIEVLKAQQALGKLVEANATALEVAALPQQPGEPAVFDQARLQAAQSGLRLGALIPTLWIDVAPRGLAYEVRIDGATPREDAPYHLDPGPHEVWLAARGFQTLQLQVNLLEAERQTLTATLFEDPDARPASAGAGEPAAAPLEHAAVRSELAAAPAHHGVDPARTLGWLGVGVAGLAVGVGAFAGISALQQKPDCPKNVCAPSQRVDIDSSKKMGVIANVSFGVALVAGGLGLWQLLSSSDAPPPQGAAQRRPSGAGPSLAVGVGPLELQVSGRF